MSKTLQRGTVISAVIAILFLATAALAQMPTSPWKKAAPFPEPDEELYGVAVDGKLYVIGGFGSGKAPGATYEYDPGTDKWNAGRALTGWSQPVFAPSSGQATCCQPHA